MGSLSTAPDGRASIKRPDYGALGQMWLSAWTRWVGFRYLMSKKNSRFLSFITLLSIVGVSLGVTAMIVVLSVMDGFEQKLRERLLEAEMHLLVTPTSEVAGFERGFAPSAAVSLSSVVDADAWLKSRVVSAWPVVATEVILKSAKKVSGTVIKGVTPDRLERLRASAAERMPETRDPEKAGLPGLVIGQELSFEMGMIPGDVVSVISPIDTEGPMSSVPRLKRFVVEGVYRSGLHDQERHTVFASDQAVRSFLRRADVVSHWELSLRSLDDAPVAAEHLRKALPGYRVQDWIELNAHLFASLRLERVAMFVILAFIVIVASFNILTTLTLMVLEKKKEISILKAMGARNSQVAAVFLAEGLFIGAVGVASGVLLGFLICGLLKRYQFIELPDIYYDRTLPVTFDAFYYLAVTLAAVAIVLVACLYPARRASRIDPIEGIRFG